MAQKLRKVVKTDFGAFVGRLELLPPPQPSPPKAPHPLTDLAFTVADVLEILPSLSDDFPVWILPFAVGLIVFLRVRVILCRFDVSGHVTGFGNPDWARTHDAATATATSVSVAVDGGATCVGKTVVDDMCFG